MQEYLPLVDKIDVWDFGLFINTSFLVIAYNQGLFLGLISFVCIFINIKGVSSLQLCSYFLEIQLIQIYV